MTKRELEHLMRKAGEIARDRDFFLVGSQAIRGVCPVIPRDFPKTIEADLYPRRYPQAWSLLRDKLGRGSAFFKRTGYYLDCTDPALSTIPDGWLERLIAFRTPRTGGVTGWCLEPHDLFVAKPVAWREKDQLFLKAMLRHKLAKSAVIRLRINDLPVAPERKQELCSALEELIRDCRTKSPKKRKTN